MSILRRMRIVVIAVLILGTGMIFWSVQSCSEIRSVEASLFVEFINDANYTFNVSGYIYMYADGQIRFNNTEVQGIGEESFTFIELDDGSGIYFDLSQLKPKESVKFQIDKIEVGETLHQNISTVRFNPSFHSINSTDVGYRAIFKLIGETSLCTIPVASKHVFTVRLDEMSILIESYNRTSVQEYLLGLHIIALILLAGFCLSIYFREIREWFPFITLIMVLLTIFVYVFIGSGWEINYMSGMESFKFLAFVPFFVHGYYGHITNNLIYFGLASLLIETICLHNRAKWRRFAQWYLLPLVILSLFGGFRFIGFGEFGFGLSFAVEAMTWVLWAYILKNFRFLATRRIYVFMTILSGIPSFVFLGWVISSLFYPTRNPYYNELADGHIWFGIISAIIVFLLVFGDDVVSFVRSKVPFRKTALGSVQN